MDFNNTNLPEKVSLRDAANYLNISGIELFRLMGNKFLPFPKEEYGKPAYWYCDNFKRNVSDMLSKIMHSSRKLGGC